MNENKVMCNIIPIGSCPSCGNRSFIVDAISHDRYLTNKYGEIKDHAEVNYNAVGICTKCYTKYPMMPTRDGFIPVSRIRSIMYDFTPHNQVLPDYLKDKNSENNPMEG